ncbi:MAG: hypothetical protein EOO38_28520 [Cytophagaceae bacterium]|nr:MAG: hypothetical protein EOO38_28520 [Cytophagaceae bacterium]
MQITHCSSTTSRLALDKPASTLSPRGPALRQDEAGNKADQANDGKKHDKRSDYTNGCEHWWSASKKLRWRLRW